MYRSKQSNKEEEVLARLEMPSKSTFRPNTAQVDNYPSKLKSVLTTLSIRKASKRAHSFNFVCFLFHLFITSKSIKIIIDVN